MTTTEATKVGGGALADEEPSLFPEDLASPEEFPVEEIELDKLLSETALEATAGFKALVKRMGIWFPIVVERREGGFYKVRDGLRRIDAARAAGHKTIRAIIVPPGASREVLTVALNWARSRNIAAEYRAVQTLAREGRSARAIAEELCQPVRSIEKLLSLAMLPPAIHEAFLRGEVSPSVAFRVVKLPATVARKLEAEFQESGVLTGKMVHEARAAKAEQAIEALPQELFGPVPGEERGKEARALPVDEEDVRRLTQLVGALVSVGVEEEGVAWAKKMLERLVALGGEVTVSTSDEGGEEA